MPVEVVDQFLAQSVVSEFEKLTACGGVESGVQNSIRCISVLLAKEIGVEGEFALAAFFDGNLPTKVHPISRFHIKNKTKKRIKKEDDLISNWLIRLASIQSSNRFLNELERWKSWIQKQDDVAS
jgi:hypothetical protein